MTLPFSADGSPRVDPAPVLISTELELPVVTRAERTAPPPQVFAAVWTDLVERGWTALDPFGVVRDHPSEGPCISSYQAMSTDTGPIIELVASPSSRLDGIAAQMTALESEARAALDRVGCEMLGSGIHPGLRPVPADYYRYRTPRPAYDYAVSQRGWRHWSIVDKAAVQELVDVSFEDAPRAVRVLHRLAGLMNFVLRNDPSIHSRHGRRLSVRSLAWRSHVPRSGPFARDARKVAIPATEIDGWRGYLSLLWDAGPMFLVGTKNHGQAYVPEHPTFLEFLERTPADGWHGRLLDGSPARVRPEAAHVAATDWSYMGFARIRWKWRTPPDVAEIVAAWHRGEIEALLAGRLEKVVIENRCNSTQPPGQELVSLALVAGLLANLDEAEELTQTSPYSFWVRLLDDSTHVPLRAAVVLGRSVADLATQMLAVATRGLVRRGEPAPDAWLAPLHQRIEDGVSPSELRLRELDRGGMDALVRSVRI